MNRLKFFWERFKAKYIPSLVWRNDLIEARVQFPLDKNTFKMTREVEEAFHKMGIHFDTGAGCGNRDWEWDWSLRGPIEIHFVRKKRKS